MKKRILMSLAAMLCLAFSAIAQTTALVVYEGGYFVKNGDKWVEYRPADKTEPWNEYKQYRETDQFYYIKSKRCNVSVPKIPRDKVLVDRKKNGNWEVVYNTISVHPVCPYTDGLFYCYTTTSTEYDGYFVRDNNKWIEFRPNMKRDAWAQFTQVGEDENYFILKSEYNTVFVPKTLENRFVIKKNDNSSWRGGYTPAAIYDLSATYDYSFNYTSVLVAKRGDNFKPAAGTGRISFDRKGNIQIAYDGKHYDFKYRSIKYDRYEGRPAVCISIDDKNNVWITSQEQCIVDCKKIGRKMTFVGCDNKAAYNEVNETIRVSPIIFWGK